MDVGRITELVSLCASVWTVFVAIYVIVACTGYVEVPCVPCLPLLAIRDPLYLREEGKRVGVGCPS